MVRRTIYTIGHSNRGIGDFLLLLAQRGIEVLIDVRRFPTSKKHPHFARPDLEKTLTRAGRDYKWFGDLLGGYRSGGYGAYLGTEMFRVGLELLEQVAAQRKTAIMCAELLYFRCHRRFISDVLVKRGWVVLHILDEKRTVRHKLRVTQDGQLEMNLSG